jgi:class 3 adenylate cyclase
MEFRIGINMGDVVIEGDNLYGEGVNVAARLEALAQPGGVCLSKNVHEIVNKKTNFQFHDLGEQTVKGIFRNLKLQNNLLVKNLLLLRCFHLPT